MSGKADIRLFLVVHETFRRYLRRIAAAAAAIPPGDTARADVVRERWAFFERTLTHHHEGEDAKLFPALLAHRHEFEQVRGELHADHEVVAGEMEAVDAAFTALPGRCDAADIAALVAALGALEETLVPHLDREDAEVLPMIADGIPPAEWDELSEEQLKSIPKHDLGFAVAALDETIATMPDDEQPPPPPVPVRLMLAVSWRRRWRKFMAPLAVSPS
jgi:hemerythrin-like domain-containing protein